MAMGAFSAQSPSGIVSGDIVELLKDMSGMSLYCGDLVQVKEVSNWTNKRNGGFDCFLDVVKLGKANRCILPENVVKKYEAGTLKCTDLKSLNKLPHMVLCLSCGNPLLDSSVGGKYCPRCP